MDERYHRLEPLLPNTNIYHLSEVTSAVEKDYIAAHTSVIG